MRRFLHTDSIGTGLVVGLGTMVLYSVLLVVGLHLVGEPLGVHLRWLGGMFIPLALLLHVYAKRLQMLNVTRTLIVVLFVGFIAYLMLLLKTNSLSLT